MVYTASNQNDYVCDILQTPSTLVKYYVVCENPSLKFSVSFSNFVVHVFLLRNGHDPDPTSNQYNHVDRLIMI